MDVNQLISESREISDMEKYRDQWESASHWFARKKFLTVNWPNYHNKKRLICLSEVWANMRFHGNRYPAAAEAEVKNMEQGVGDAHNLLQEHEYQANNNQAKRRRHNN